MSQFFEQLSQEEIINSNDIKRMKQSIEIQYPHLTSKQKAQKLATIVFHLIDLSLPNFSNEVKRNVRNSLLKQKLSDKSSLSINSQDIIDSSIELVAICELQKELPIWLQSKLNVEMSTIEKYVYTRLEIPMQAMEEIAVTNILESVELSKQEIFRDKAKLLSNDVNSAKNGPFKSKYVSAAIIAFFIMIPIIHGLEKAQQATSEPFDPPVVIEKNEAPVASKNLSNELPNYLQYQSINEEKLRIWLNERNSKLADEPYFSTIISVAQDHNLHPFLLFAVTGQEQGFVPRTHPKAAEIVNNPFNVFHSWEDYNSNILDSSQIAARTISNLSQERPNDVHPIQWINRKYAEDPNWWQGVSAIFEKLEREVQS